MSVNKVILIGNVGKEPDIKYFDNDNVKANFSLATNDRAYTAANGTQIPERTEWHNIVCWRGLAQVVEKFVKKGTKIYVEGKIRSRTYDDSNGVKRYITEINADNIEILSGRDSQFGDNHDKNDSSFSTERMPDSLSENSEIDDLPF